MSALLIQAPDSKRWHVAPDTRLKPLCSVDERWTDRRRWRIKGSSRWPHMKWRAPAGICCNCAREVESAVRLIATEEAAG